jgi:hypothetical protein
MELTSNKAVEDAAVAWVMDLEKAAGRHAVDMRRTGAPADVASPPRSIEVKAYGQSARGRDLWLEPSQVEAAERDAHYYVYVVENVRQGNPDHFQLRVLGGAELKSLLKRRREQRYYIVPWPVGVYDETPTGLR